MRTHFSMLEADFGCFSPLSHSGHVVCLGCVLDCRLVRNEADTLARIHRLAGGACDPAARSCRAADEASMAAADAVGAVCAGRQSTSGIGGDYGRGRLRFCRMGAL